MELPPANESGSGPAPTQQELYYEVQFNRYARDEVGTVEWNTSPFVEWKPRSNVRVSFGPAYEHSNVDASTSPSTTTRPRTATYGRRFVFARLDQQTVAANFRLSWAFNPTMSLQTYIQPYVTSGDYWDFRALAKPGTYTFEAVPAPFNPSSTTARCAATRCSAGSTCRARRCSWCGPSSARIS